MFSDPLAFFNSLYKQYQDTEVSESSAMTLATATTDARPSARVVLLKAFDESGFAFYTNLGSRKALELAKNPFAALCFYWEPIGYQIRIEGTVVKVSDTEADIYFDSRPRDSQIGAWASRQSETLSSRATLDARVNALNEKYAGRDVPRPDFWSGYKVVPERYEFWQRRLNRLHERICYVKNNIGWQRKLLYP